MNPSTEFERKFFSALTFLLLGIALSAQRPGSWLELPVIPRSDWDKAYAVKMTVSGHKQRNYTFLWNESHMTADWVAYPLCRGNMGQGKRTNDFGFCPLLSHRKQPDVSRAYRNGNSGPYSRGHQIPSADRLEYNANVQTFYGVNMTPQDENLNGGVWSTLENKVRAWARQCDTLYVVSGCTYDGYKGAYVFDNVGKKVAVPTGYYKAILIRNGNTFRAGGFMLENRQYDSGKLTNGMSLPLGELEKKTGLVFFPGLKAIVGKDEYERLKTSRL